MALTNAYTVTLQAKLNVASLQKQIDGLKLNIGSGGTTTATKNFTNITKAITDTSKASESLSSNLQQNIGKVLQWGLATGAIYGTLAKIKEGTQYIIDLNKELVNTQIVTGMTSDQISDLSLKYNQLGQSMGATTLEVAQGSLEWFRQGKTVEEAMDLTSKSIVMAKLANMDTAQSTEYLTSIINGFKLEVGETTLVIDKLISLDNAYATSVAEIASAMQRSSNSASQAGVTLDELASYITVLSSVTRKSSESIGESFKTMFARMQNIKLGKIFEDDPTTLNDVEKALTLIDVKLRDTENSFRPLGDVMDEVASKWSTMNDIEQSAVANAIAGVRQRENFLVLMNNYDEVLKAQSIEMDAAGLSTERYAVYMEGLEAAINKSKAAWEGVWQATIESGSIKWFYDFSSSIAEAITKVGGLSTVIMGLVTVVGVLKAGNIATLFVNIANSVYSAITAVQGLSTGLTALSATSLIGIFIAIAGAITTIAMAIPTAEEKLEALNKKIATTVDELDKLYGSQKSLAELGDEFEELKNKSALTSDEQERFLELQQKIKDIAPSIAGFYNEQGEFLLDESVKLSDVNKLLQEQIDLKKAIIDLDYIQNLSTTEQAYAKLQDELEGYLAHVEYINTTMTGAVRDSALADVNIDISKVTNDMRLMEVEAGQTFSRMSDEGRASFSAIADFANPLYSEVIRFKEEMLRAENLSPMIEELRAKTDETVPTIEELSVKTKELYANIDALQSSVTGLVGAMREQDDVGYLSNETAMKLIGSNAELAKYLYQTAEGWRIDGEQAIIDIQAQILAARTALEVAKAKMIETAALYDSASAQYVDAQAAVDNANAQLKLLSAMKGQLLTWNQIPTSVGRATSAVKSYNDELKKSYNAQIKAHEKEKKRLQDLLKAYKKIIDAKKDSLRADKESADYARELEQKQRKAADIQAEIEQLKLDNSAEANARRLELEAELADAQFEIQEFQADRSYDLQMEALDKEYELFEEMINKQIEAIDLLIEKIREMIDALNDAKSNADGNNNSNNNADFNWDTNGEWTDAFGGDNMGEGWWGEGGNDPYANTNTNTNTNTNGNTNGNSGCFLAGTQISMGDGSLLSIEKVKIGDKVMSYDFNAKENIVVTITDTKEHLKEEILPRYLIINDDLEVTPEHPMYVENEWVGAGSLKIGDLLFNIRHEKVEIKSIQLVKKSVPVYNLHTGNEHHNYFANGILVHNMALKFHEGGIVGDLAANEEFAKLMDGEVVNNKTQMDRFMDRTLPEIISSGGGNNITFEMPITVGGNLDKTVLPDLESMINKAFEKMNSTLLNRGYQRGVDQMY